MSIEPRRHRAHASARGVSLAPPLRAGARYAIESHALDLAVEGASLPTTDGVAFVGFPRSLLAAFALLPTAAYFRLIGRHDDEQVWFELGRGPTVIEGRGRNLVVALNDVALFFDDHDGEIDVVIREVG